MVCSFSWLGCRPVTAEIHGFESRTDRLFTRKHTAILSIANNRYEKMFPKYGDCSSEVER